MFKIKFRFNESTPFGCIIGSLAIAAYSIISWFVNLYKLTQCDFASPWKDEIVHIIGLMPGACWVTCWM